MHFDWVCKSHVVIWWDRKLDPELSSRHRLLTSSSVVAHKEVFSSNPSLPADQALLTVMRCKIYSIEVRNDTAWTQQFNLSCQLITFLLILLHMPFLMCNFKLRDSSFYLHTSKLIFFSYASGQSIFNSLKFKTFREKIHFFLLRTCRMAYLRKVGWAKSFDILLVCFCKSFLFLFFWHHHF